LFLQEQIKDIIIIKAQCGAAPPCRRAATVRQLLLCGTAWQQRIWPSWASNDAPSKDLSNTPALQHLAPLATDYWDASQSFIEPRIVTLEV